MCISPTTFLRVSVLVKVTLNAVTYKSKHTLCFKHNSCFLLMLSPKWVVHLVGSNPPSSDSATQASSMMLDTYAACSFQACWVHLHQVNRKGNNMEGNTWEDIMGQIWQWYTTVPNAMLGLSHMTTPNLKRCLNMWSRGALRKSRKRFNE